MWGGMNRGGAETLLLDMFENDHTAPFPFIGIHRKGGSMKELFDQTSPEIFCCRPLKGNFIGYFRNLRSLLKKQQITLVHAQQFLDCLYARIATIGTGIKVVQTFHGYDYDANLWSRFMIKVSLHIADINCFVSRQQQKYYTQRYHLPKKKNPYTIYNGINFDKLSVSSPIPETSLISSSSLKMAMVGNFVSVRDQMFVCQVLKTLRDRGVDFDFYFVGKKNDNEPWLYDNCVAFCNDNGLSSNVHFMGGRSDVPYILKQMDAFVYCSDHDTFGIAVIEAIAAGLPTFVNDWPVMLEVTNKGVLASVYASGDVDALVQKLSSFAQDIYSHKQQATAHAETIQQLFSIQKHQEQLYRCYLSVLSREL